MSRPGSILDILDGPDAPSDLYHRRYVKQHARETYKSTLPICSQLATIVLCGRFWIATKGLRPQSASNIIDIGLELYGEIRTAESKHNFNVTEYCKGFPYDFSTSVDLRGKEFPRLADSIEGAKQELRYRATGRYLATNGILFGMYKRGSYANRALYLPIPSRLYLKLLTNVPLNQKDRDEFDSIEDIPHPDFIVQRFDENREELLNHQVPDIFREVQTAGLQLHPANPDFNHLWDVEL